MDKRYQVFVSSTYTDLQDERQAVTKTLMSLDCIPAGMEMFGAFDEDQWDFIQRVIDDCDYYLLIIAGRYGSMTEEGISFTEMEYKYAIEKDIPVIAMLHENPEEISVKKSDTTPELMTKLNEFREHVSDGRLVDFWKTPDDLAGKVAVSLSRTMKLKPAVGWVRADKAANEDILIDINGLRKDKDELLSQVQKLQKELATQTPEVENIAHLDETYTVTGEYFETYYKRYSTWSVEVSWKDIFSLVAPYLIEHPNDITVKSKLQSDLFKLSKHSGRSPEINDQIYKTISLQLKALSLVTIARNQTVGGGYGVFWGITPSGEKTMLEARLVRKKETLDEPVAKAAPKT